RARARVGAPTPAAGRMAQIGVRPASAAGSSDRGVREVARRRIGRPRASRAGGRYGSASTLGSREEEDLEGGARADEGTPLSHRWIAGRVPGRGAIVRVGDLTSN